MGHLWLIGMMGSGKSAAGRQAAATLGVAFVDTDAAIVAQIGGTIAGYWAQHGEDAFRTLESAAVTATAAGPPAVVATGGGAVLDAANVAAMRSSGTVVWLTADPAVLAARIGDSGDRPLLTGTEPVEALRFLLAERGPAYRAAAHAEIETGSRGVPEVAAKVVGLWTDC